MLIRQLGRSGIQISAMGLGCWAIGGPYGRPGEPNGWGQIDDDQSIGALRRGLDMGVNFIDTSDVYGCGHSERIVAQAVAGRRDDAVIATKFGFTFEEDTRHVTGGSADPDYIRRACEASLKRLNTDCIDLYQFHLAGHDLDEAVAARDVLEQLVAAGKIRWYGWSTDDPERARQFAQGEHCAAIQQHFDVFGGNAETLTVCQQQNLASISRGPLAMGMLTGKFSADSKFPDDDVRHDWNFKDGPQSEQLHKLDALREVLTSGGRTLAQGALAWLWARSDNIIPIPGFKTVKQVEENAGALQFGPLSADELSQAQSLVD